MNQDILFGKLKTLNWPCNNNYIIFYFGLTKIEQTYLFHKIPIFLFQLLQILWTYGLRLEELNISNVMFLKHHEFLLYSYFHTWRWIISILINLAFTNTYEIIPCLFWLSYIAQYEVHISFASLSQLASNPRRIWTSRVYSTENKLKQNR